MQGLQGEAAWLYACRVWACCGSSLAPCNALCPPSYTLHAVTPQPPSYTLHAVTPQPIDCTFTCRLTMRRAYLTRVTCGAQQAAPTDRPTKGGRAAAHQALQQQQQQQRQRHDQPPRKPQCTQPAPPREGQGQRQAAPQGGGREDVAWKRPGGAFSAKAKKEYLQWKRSQKRGKAGEAEGGEAEGEGRSGDEQQGGQAGAESVGGSDEDDAGGQQGRGVGQRLPGAGAGQQGGGRGGGGQGGPGSGRPAAAAGRRAQAPAPRGDRLVLLAPSEAPLRSVPMEELPIPVNEAGEGPTRD